MNYRKFLTIFIPFSLLSVVTSARVQESILTCLGQEELRLHKLKKKDAHYHLNQTFINKLSSTNDILLSKDYLSKICHASNQAPSLNLLRYLLTDGKKVFDLKRTDKTYRGLMVDDLIKGVPHIFFSYIAKIQLQTPTAHCLEKHIPEIPYFNERYKYLEEEMSVSELMADKKKILNIFSQLDHLPQIIKKCQEDKLKKKK